MAILVDDAIWPWRGLQWAHLVSDSHLDELHAFAHRLGMPYVAFQGDHYDIHARMREAALDAGARAVPGRDLVVALRDAGLRRRGGVEPWSWQVRVDASALPTAAIPGRFVEQVAVAASMLHEEVVAAAGRTAAVEVAVAARPGETLVMVSSEVTLEVDAGLTPLDETTTLHRSSGERGTFVEWVEREVQPRSASMPTSRRSSM